MKNKFLRQPNIANGSISFLLATLLNLVAQSIVGIVIFSLKFSSPELVNTVNVAGMLVIQICVSFTLLVNYKQGVKAGNFTAKWQTVLCAVGLGVLSIFGFAIASGGFDKLLNLLGYTNASYITLNPFSMVVFLLATVVCAPVVEETIFRGYLLNGLKSRLPKPVAVILSAFAFSLIHMSPSQTAYQFCFGLALGFVASETNSILPAIVMHSASNLTAFVIAVCNLNVTALAVGSATGVIVFSLLLLFTVAVLVFALKLMKKWENSTTKSEEVAVEKAETETAQNGEEKRLNIVALCAYITGALVCAFMWAMVFIAV